MEFYWIKLEPHKKGTRPENDIPHSDVLPLWSLFLARWSKTAVTPFCIRCYVPFCKQTADGSTNRTEPKYGLSYEPAALMECLPTHFPMRITHLNSKKRCQNDQNLTLLLGWESTFWNILYLLSIIMLSTAYHKNEHFLCFLPPHMVNKVLFEKFWEWTLNLKWISSWFTKDFQNK